MNVGQQLEDTLLVTEATLSQTKNGRDYYALELRFRDGTELDGRVWSEAIDGELSAGDLAKFRVEVDEYKGEKQLKVLGYKVLADPGELLEEFTESTDVDVDSCFEEMFDPDGVSDITLSRLLERFYESDSFREDFTTSPAATHHHHNYRGGLVEHTHSVWSSALQACESRSEEINRDLVWVGAALHDIGKTRCYRLESGVPQSTDLRRLLGHVTIGYSMFAHVWENLGSDSEEGQHKKNMIAHMILSHHGKKEWGAPVLPKTPEAILLHYCDVIDANLKKVSDHLDDVEEWTDYVDLTDGSRPLISSSM